MTSEALQNPYFVRLYCTYINIDIAHFNYKIVQNRSLFLGGGGGGVRKDSG